MAEYDSLEKPVLKKMIKEATQQIEDLALTINRALAAKVQKSTMRVDESKPRRCFKRRLFHKGHFSKVVSCAWDRSSELVLTSSQDGNIIIWNAVAGRKQTLQPLKSSWVMFAEASTEGDAMICSGGLDNFATVWKFPTVGSDAKSKTVPVKTCTGHDGYVCNARFFPGDKLVTTSGDGTSGLWDLSRPESKDSDSDDRLLIFEGHEKDVTSLDAKPGSASEFVTSSADGAMMLWDVKHNRPNLVMRLFEKELCAPGAVRGTQKRLKDVNKVKWQSNGVGVGCATEACGSFLYDTRTRGVVNTYCALNSDLSADAKKSCAFSTSGRLFFVAGEDFSVEIWDTLQPNATKPLQSISMHDNTCTDVSVAASGFGCATSSWDNNAGLIAP